MKETEARILSLINRIKREHERIKGEMTKERWNNKISREVYQQVNLNLLELLEKSLRQ